MILRIFVAVTSLVALLAVQAAPATQSVPLFHDSATFHGTSTQRQALGAYTPSEIAAAYNFTPLLSRGIDGTGQTVALIEIDRFKSSDIRKFDTKYHLPAPTIKQFYVGGHTFSLEKSGETTLDIEWLHALIPHAVIQVYYVANKVPEWTSWQHMATALHMAASHGAGTVSISLGTCGPGLGFQATETAFADLAKLGVTTFVSSGDSGARPGPVRYCGRKITVAYPAGDPSVVSVGGTTLELNVFDSITSEAAWNLSGGGRLKSLLRAPWQVAPQLPHDKYRWAPDVAFVGDPRTGVSVFWNGKWYQVGGTSLGAPAWAAAWALIRQDAQTAGDTVGSAGPLIYDIGNSASYPQAFHDIISGSNGHYRAKPGWDAVTGWGTPDVQGLATAVEALPAPH